LREHVVPTLALASVAAFLAWPLVNPHLTPASAYFLSSGSSEAEPGLVVTGSGGQIIRDGEWSVTKSPSFGVPATGTPNPGSAQAIARDLVLAGGMDEGEYQCLHALWAKESGWNHFAQNRSSGAYGIPQALPGAKMASAGEDWATNPETQIRWGLGYIDARYGSPCAAWQHSQQKNWY
jgi:hypothetical protein